MYFIDLHCDTASCMLYRNAGLNSNNLSVDINKLIKGRAKAQTFAFFIDAGEVEDVQLEFEKMYDNFIREIEINKDFIEVVKNIKELEEVNKNNKIGAFLSIEEGGVLKGNVDNLVKVYNKGIRLITLTWNYKNELGYPNYNYIYKDKGLTSVGKEIVSEMEHLGIIPDGSHLSDKGFYDLIDICKKPFILTHSNSREITNHPRNISDDMIKLLANKGGVMGMNFCAEFLGHSKIAKIEEIINHIKHIRNVGGIDVIALGSDFDGITNEVEISNCSEMYKLSDALEKEGFSYDEIEKIYYKNTVRVFKEILKE